MTMMGGETRTEKALATWPKCWVPKDCNSRVDSCARCWDLEYYF